MAFTQSNDFINMAESHTARIVVNFIGQNGVESYQEFGKGIVLKGKYFATCYHLVVPRNGNYKLGDIYLIHNERVSNGKILGDSILLIKDFDPTKEQYDFRNHVFNRNERKTDFIILKLSKPIKEINHKFSNSYPNVRDTLYCLGNVLKGNILYQSFQTPNLLFYYTEDSTMPFLFMSYFIQYTNGYSGTPLFNYNREILGMVQFSIEDYHEQEMFDLLLRDKIDLTTYKLIKQKYSEGYKLQFAIDFNYIKNKYLKGYL